MQKSRVWQKGKKCLQKNCILKGLENFAKNRFSEKKNLWELLDARVLHIPLLLIPFAPVLRVSEIIKKGTYTARAHTHDENRLVHIYLSF